MRVDVIFVVTKQHLLEKEDVVSFNQKTGTGGFYDSKKFALLVLDESFLENIKKFTFNDYRTGRVFTFCRIRFMRFKRGCNSDENFRSAGPVGS